MKHIITLSNGSRCVLEEDEDALHIASLDENHVDWFIATITPSGVLVMPNSGSEPEWLTKGLRPSDESVTH